MCTYDDSAGILKAYKIMCVQLWSSVKEQCFRQYFESLDLRGYPKRGDFNTQATVHTSNAKRNNSSTNGQTINI